METLIPKFNRSFILYYVKDYPFTPELIYEIIY